MHIWNSENQTQGTNLLFEITESPARNRLESSYKDIAPPPHGVAVQRLLSLVALFEESKDFALIVVDAPFLRSQCNIRQYQGTEYNSQYTISQNEWSNNSHPFCEAHLSARAPPLDAVLPFTCVPSNKTDDNNSAYMAPPKPPQALESNDASLEMLSLPAVTHRPPPCNWALFLLIMMKPSRIKTDSEA